MASISAAGLAARLGISRSYLYRLKDSGAFAVETAPDGKIRWDDALEPAIRAHLERAGRREGAARPPKPDGKPLQLHNRRYLGGKHKLAPWIRSVVQAHCSGVHVVADLFAGTGAASCAFEGTKRITNDLLYSSYLCNVAWFGAQEYHPETIRAYIAAYNAQTVTEENYMTAHFADTYFSRADCAKIGFIREDIERQWRAGALNDRERAILITALLYAMDQIANTCGHYDAYRRGAAFDKPLELRTPEPPVRNHPGNQCFHTDANALARHIEADLVYLDPPYNSRQYCDAYHLLENVARWEKPPVYGVARKMERSSLKSDYCTKRAAAALDDLVGALQTKYILLSYNNMAEKGDVRSNAKLSDDDIWRILSKKGDVQVFSRQHRAFSAGKSRIAGNEERLFLCTCHPRQKELLPSPLNYTGGKYKLLPQLLPHFPADAGHFVDLFCGGCNVGINAACSHVSFYDSNDRLLRLYRTLQTMEREEVFRRIDDIIARYGLSQSAEHGYAAYGCNGADGLAAYNRAPFLRLRAAYNERAAEDAQGDLMLYVLIVFSFNNQIRFNREGAFNLPVGKRDFNSRMRTKLARFIDRLKSGAYTFTTADFRTLAPESFAPGTFFYADPPYLITCASYNEQDGWNETAERELLAFLDRVHACGHRFALSNVLRSKGRENRILIGWAERNAARYRVIPLAYDYANSSYHTKDKSRNTQEVLIVN